MKLPGLGRRTSLTIAGGAMVAVGLVLIPVPVLPGWPLVIGGAALIRKARRAEAQPPSLLPEPASEIDSEAASA